jgi:hypothetical protein
MKFQNKGGVEAYIFIGKAMVVFLSGGIFFHIIVMIIDYYLVIEPFHINLRENFTGLIFSEPMIPMMAAYGLLSLGTLLGAREKEFQKENAEAVLKSMQRLTGIMSEHIASQNSEIMSWIQNRKRLGHPVPIKVENSSQQIAKAIQSMSELTFIAPYTDNSPNNPREFEKILIYKLSNITEARSQEYFPLKD